MLGANGYLVKSSGGPREETVRGYEINKDQYVRFEPEELKALEQPSEFGATHPDCDSNTVAGEGAHSGAHGSRSGSYSVGALPVERRLAEGAAI